jgi:hypothetical protein
MTTGSPDDLVARVKQEIPKGWFKWVAPYRDAIIGGLSDNASWCYGFIGYARSQTRLATAYGIWLDILSYDFLGRFFVRNKAADDTFRALIRATILQERVTRAGMINAVKALTGNTSWIFEPWNTFDTGAYSGAGGASSPTPKYGQMGYGVGQGGYGSMVLPGQVFMKVARSAASGVPGVGGYGSNIDGYGVGAIEYVGPSSELSGITDDMIYRMINMTKATGTTMWVAFQAPTSTVLVTETGVILKDDSGNTLVVG